MTPINNSDTAWLIVSDYNQDNNLPYEELREDVLNPDVNNWSIYYMYETQGTDSVGGGRRDSNIVGCDIENPNLLPMEELYCGQWVGGVGSRFGGQVGGNRAIQAVPSEP